MTETARSADDASVPSDDVQGQATGVGRAKRFSIVGFLSISHEIPSTLMTLVVPTVFVKQLGMPLSYMGFFAIPVIISALKWLWAPLVERTGSPQFGRRRSWILPSSFMVSFLYLIMAGIEPSLEALPLVVGLFVLVKIAFSTFEIAADAYVVEAFGEGDRGVAASAVWFGKELGQIIGLAGVMLVSDLYGWGPAFLTVAILFSLFNLSVLWAPEQPHDPSIEEARAAGERAKAMNYLRHPINRRVLGFIFFFAFAVQMPPAAIGPFLASKGLSLTAVGTTVGIAASLGAGLSLAIAAQIIKRVGPKRMARYLIPVGLLALPGFLWLAMAAGPALPAVMIVIFIGSVCTAPVRMTIYAARMGWTSKTQVGTDFTIQQSVFFLGYGASLVMSGLIAQYLGWTFFFVLNGLLVVAALLVFIRWYDGIVDEIAALQKLPSPSA